MVIANYFFDSLPMDVWEIDENELKACCPRIIVNDDAKHLAHDDYATLESTALNQWLSQNVQGFESTELVTDHPWAQTFRVTSSTGVF